MYVYIIYIYKGLQVIHDTQYIYTHTPVKDDRKRTIQVISFA